MYRAFTMSHSHGPATTPLHRQHTRSYTTPRHPCTTKPDGSSVCVAACKVRHAAGTAFSNKALTAGCCCCSCDIPAGEAAAQHRVQRSTAAIQGCCKNCMWACTGDAAGPKQWRKSQQHVPQTTAHPADNISYNAHKPDAQNAVLLA